MYMNLQLFSREASASREEDKEKKTKTKAATAATARGETLSLTQETATPGASNQAVNTGTNSVMNSSAYSAVNGTGFGAAYGAAIGTSDVAPYSAGNAVTNGTAFGVGTSGLSQGEQDTEPTGQTEKSVAHGEQGKPLTLEERIGRLEALLESHRDTAHSARSYEQARKQRQAASQTQLVQETYRKLQAQTQEAQQLYPNLNLAQEAKDPRFVELLKCGLDVKSAFEVIHKDEIIAASMEYAAREVERLLTNKVLAERGRPTENGGIHGPALSKTDPKYMTRQERKDIIRRVFAGEKITF